MHHYVLCSSESVLQEEKGSINFLTSQISVQIDEVKIENMLLTKEVDFISGIFHNRGNGYYEW